jgi:uncharacterized protein (TIGR03086 family)
MATEGLEKAYATAREVLSNVKPAQYDDPTPCESFNVGQLIDHMIGASYFFTMVMNGEEIDVNAERPSFIGGDVVAAYDEGAKATIAAFNEPGALDKTVKPPFGEFPAMAFLGLATNEMILHGWDLAKATGQSTDLAPDLAAQLLDNAMLPDEFRGPNGQAPFGPKVDVPASACAADRLAGYFGRQP